MDRPTAFDNKSDMCISNTKDENHDVENSHNMNHDGEKTMDPVESKLKPNIEPMDIDENHENYGRKRKNWPIFRIPNLAVNVVEGWYTQNREFCWMVIVLLLFSGLTTYMVIVLVWNFERATTLLVMWCLFVGYKGYAYIRDTYGKEILKFLKPVFDIIKRNAVLLKWAFIALLVIGLAVWIALDTSKRPNQLISGAGYLIFLFCLFLTSTHPSQVKWRPVLWGLFIQICLALIILRTKGGFDAFNWLGILVQNFLNFTDAGVIFLYGTGYEEHFFAFKVLAIVIYFSAFVSVMYYLGVVQWILLKISWIMQVTLGTSGTETMVAAGNIFIGQTEAPLLIKPFLEDLTTSELFAVMVCGFATVAGSTLGAYISFGIDPIYIITACVMSSPCALAVAKLVSPETQKSKFSSTTVITLEKGAGERNLIDAAAQGASVAIFLVLNIGANLIVFLSMLALLNGILSWFGGLADFPQLSFELICSYIFVPVSYLMGIEWDDCLKSAELLGVGIFLNEFVAYGSLAGMIKARDKGTIPRFDPETGSVNWISERSEAIMTYALCGFANVGSIGIVLGGLGSLAPSRRGEMAEVVVKAILVGTAVNILNACVAGFLYEPRSIFCDNMLATTNWSYTVPSRLYECCSNALERADNSSIICNCCNYSWNETMFNLNCSMTTC